MPYASDPRFNEEQYLRQLLYGPAKTKKTWYAAKCAELGFNVILLDGDDGAHIVNNLSLEARKRILAVKLTPTVSKTVFVSFMAQFLRQKEGGFSFLWDENDRRASAIPVPDHSYIRFNASKLTANDVVVLDSWTALADSTKFQFADEHELDLSDANKTEWDGFNWEGNFLNWVLSRLHTLSCQVIVIGHATVYEKWDRRDKKNPKLLEQRTQPISCSGPHGKKLAKHFTDVLNFYKISDTVFKIDTGGGRDTDGGSRFFEPKVWDWNELGPEQFFKKLGIKADKSPCEGAVYFAPGAEIPTALGKLSVASAKPQAMSATSSPPVVENQSAFGRLNIGKKA